MNKKLFGSMRKKLHSTEGFTLSETLMTVVLIGLVTTVMAGGIVAARNVYQRISLRADAQTLLATTVSAVTEDLSSVTSCEDGAGITDGTSAGNYYYAKDRGFWLRYVNETGTGSATRGIQVEPKGNPGATVPLLPDKVQTRDLYAYIASLTVTQPQSEGDGGYFTLKIQIKNSKKEDQVVEEATVCVHNQIRNLK